MRTDHVKGALASIDPNIHRRFDERRTIFSRMHWDRKASFYEVAYRGGAAEKIAQGISGYSHLDFARVLASWTVHDSFLRAFSWRRTGEADPSLATLERLAVSDPLTLTAQVKDTARLFGADLVGVCNVDERWIYSHNRSGDPIEIPAACDRAIVMAIAMDRPSVGTSPQYLSAAATGVGYSKMAFTIACMAEFLRNLRYTAIPMGNDTALSVPLAIQAGLGQMGRNGLLTTQEFGSCVRLCKVFTDLPLVPDEPIDFGLPEFCKTCRRCADACEPGAISQHEDPTFDVACPSNNPGIRRWAVNADKCYEFWAENTAACSNCIVACPYSSIAPTA
jgi:epoxyqueuosine reductase